MGNFARWGLEGQFVVSHHGDPEHNSAVVEAISSARSQGIDAILALGGFVGPVIEEVYEATFGKALPCLSAAIVRASESAETRRYRESVTRSHLHVHAEERETSRIMRWFPDSLNKEREIAELYAVLPTYGRPSTGLFGRQMEGTLSAWVHRRSRSGTTVNGELYRLEAEVLQGRLPAISARRVNSIRRFCDERLRLVLPSLLGRKETRLPQRPCRESPKFANSVVAGIWSSCLAAQGQTTTRW